ncbi:MAG: DUF3570 domain-containing protein [Polyangiales bacterium]
MPLAVASGEDTLSDEQILGPPQGVHIESARLRFTHFDQEGRGYQSKADRHGVYLPGSEQLRVEQPELEVKATQGAFSHRVFVPVDIVTAASSDALDTTSSASRMNEAVTFDLTSDYRPTPEIDGMVHVAFHVEEPYRSWQVGGGVTRSLADDNAVLSVSVHQLLDELDRFDIHGNRFGRVYRSTSNVNVGLSQLLSPTTVASLQYGGTLQRGELSNTWNAVPLLLGMLGREYLPRTRARHALRARVAQALPWDAALHVSYRFYADSWQVIAHSLEYALYQRLSRTFYLRADYRIHTQNAPSFWTLQSPKDASPRTADSDLATLRAQTVGGAAAMDLPLRGPVRELHIDLGYERYFRSNDLHVNIYTCALGFRF